MAKRPPAWADVAHRSLAALACGAQWGDRPMAAERLARALAARGIHYGWVMTGLVFFYALFSSSSLGVPAVLVTRMAQDLGLTIGELSAPQGLRFALFGLVAPFSGGLMLRYGPRRILGIAGALVLAGLL